MRKKIYPSDLTEEQFENIRELLESSKKTTKPRKYDLYDIFNAMIYVLKTGCQWDLLPHEYPHYKSVHSYFMTWSKVPKKGESTLMKALKKNGFRRSNQGGSFVYDHLFDC
jgi:transposase